MTCPLPFQIINAFAPTKHAGNQAAVVVFPTADDPRANDDAYLLAVARDFNFAETAYLVPLDTSAEVPSYGLRWFTPATEVTLCGHATLASAFVLFNDYHPKAKTISFQTRFSGILTGTIESELGKGVTIGLGLPIKKPDPDSSATTDKVASVISSALGISVEDIVNISTFAFGNDLSSIVEIKPEIALGDLTVDTKGLLPLLNGMNIVTQLVPDESSTSAIRVNSRVFAPALGVDEDPVTGSATAMLTGYFLNGSGTARVPPAFLSSGSARDATLDVRQLSQRGGAILAKWVDGRAQLVSQAWRVASGTLEV